MILLVVEFKENCFVADYMRMLELLYVDEILTQEQNMLGIQRTDLYCKQLICSFAVAFLDDSMGPLSDFFPQHVHVAK